MILSRSPLRLTLGGGGTDLPSYYEKRTGFTITGAINKYVFVSAHRQFYPGIKLRYSEFEQVDVLEDIKHPLFREALRSLGIIGGIELTSLADIPAGTGLGSSGAFLVALLNTLHVFRNIQDSKFGLATQACEIELKKLKYHEGKQDKYACAFGGIKAFEFLKNGQVSIISFPNEDLLQRELEDKLSLYYTGKERRILSSEALEYQDKQCKKEGSMMMDFLDEIRNIGYKTKQVFLQGNLDSFGRLLNDHWEIKKQYSPYSTASDIDKYYQVALDNGALGGKIMGAGGGGFFLFYHPGDLKERWKFEDAMRKCGGLRKVDFKFDMEGVKTIIGE